MAVTVDGPPAPAGPLRYFHEAIRIARLDDFAIGRMSDDRHALIYGACVMLIAGLLSSVSRMLVVTRGDTTTPPLTGLTAVVLAAVLQLAASAFNVAVIHGVAKMVFGATGRYVSLLRVLWLGSIVLWLTAVPVIGPIVGSLWFLLVSLVTFEQVDSVERLQALVLLVGLAALTFLVGTFVS